MANKKRQTKRDMVDGWTSNGTAIRNVKITDKQKKAIAEIKKNKGKK